MKYHRYDTDKHFNELKHKELQHLILQGTNTTIQSTRQQNNMKNTFKFKRRPHFQTYNETE